MTKGSKLRVLWDEPGKGEAHADLELQAGKDGTFVTTTPLLCFTLKGCDIGGTWQETESHSTPQIPGVVTFREKECPMGFGGRGPIGFPSSPREQSMPTPWNLPQSYIPLGVVLALMVLQSLLYYSRMPGEMAVKWDLSGNPSRRMGKGGFFALTWFMAVFISVTTCVGSGFLALPIAGVLLFIVIVNQYIFAANAGSGRLHSSFFLAVAGYVLAVLLLAYKFLLHP